MLPFILHSIYSPQPTIRTYSKVGVNKILCCFPLDMVIRPKIMASISQNQALCIFFQLKYSEENSIKALEKFKAFSDEFEVCYLSDPAVPVVVLKTRLYGSPFVFKEYIDEAIRDDDLADNTLKLAIKPQVLKYMNEVHSLEPVDNLYISRTGSLSDIFANILQRSDCFNNKTLNSLSSFCGKNKPNFMERGGHSRKRLKNEAGSYSRQWSLCVLDEKYQANVLQNILQYNKRYQEYLKEQKKIGVEVVGYVRKSTCGKDDDNRTKLIQKMVQILRSRSIVDKVFVSRSSAANQPFDERDVDTTTTTTEGTDGTTKDFIEFLKGACRERR